MKVVGGVSPKPPKKDTTNQRLAPSILKEYGADKKQKIKEGIAALHLIDRNQLEKATQEAKSEFLAFLSKRDSIADCQTAELLFLDLNDESYNYALVFMRNYDTVRECLTKKFESLKKDWTNFTLPF